MRGLLGVRSILECLTPNDCFEFSRPTSLTLFIHFFSIIASLRFGCDTTLSLFVLIVDGKHAVFGQVEEESFEVLQAIENCAELFDRDEQQRARITKTATIVDCGQL